MAAGMVLATCLGAAPRLRLNTYYGGDSSLLTTYAYVDPGQQLPPGVVAGVSNIGDGQLTLTVSSSASWVSGTVVPADGSRCAGVLACIVATFDTASLAAGWYTALLTVSDPNAMDTPQTITVNIWVGPTIPAQLNFYAPPGQSASARLGVDTYAYGGIQVITDVNWLGFAVEGLGPAVLSGWTFLDVGTSPSLDVGHHLGNFTLSNSLYPDDNETVNVDFDVTTDPIADTLMEGYLPTGNPAVTFTASLPTGPHATQTQFYRIQNDGPGQITVSSMEISPEASPWLSATPIAIPGMANGSGIGAGVAVTANPQSLPAGTFTGAVTVNSNAANSPTVIPVQLDVIAQGTPPAVMWPRVLNIADYMVPGGMYPGGALAPGEIAALFGVGLNEGDPVTFSPPLPILAGSGNTQVLVDGTPAPIFYANYNQINIQIRSKTSAADDAQIQVVRNGMKSPVVTVPMAPEAPQILNFGCPYANDCDPFGYGVYAIGTNDDGSFPLPETAPYPNCHPANTGDVVTFLGIGFGQTMNPLTTGAGAPSSPPATTVSHYQLCFGGGPGGYPGVCVPADVMAAPGRVGLYESKITVPHLPNDGVEAFYMTDGTYYGDPAYMAVQQSSADSAHSPAAQLEHEHAGQNQADADELKPRQRLGKEQPGPDQRPQVAERDERVKDGQLPFRRGQHEEHRRQPIENDACGKAPVGDHGIEAALQAARSRFQQHRAEGTDEGPNHHQRHGRHRRGHDFTFRPSTATPITIRLMPNNFIGGSDSRKMRNDSTETHT